MATDDLESVIARAQREGVISPAQGARMRELAADTVAPAPARVEAARGFSSINIAYGVGALLVLFASAWFLFDRWSRLGAEGVLVVAAAYAAILVALAAWLRRHDFPRAAALSVMLAVSMTPLATWSLLRLAGTWPPRAMYGAWYYYGDWMAWQWLIVELATVLAALLVVRSHPVVTLMYPIAVALWGIFWHLGRIARDEWVDADFDRWIMFTAGTAILVVADQVERWQAREQRSRDVDGDFAGPFWLVGFIAFSAAVVALWEGSGAWHHLLLPTAVGVLAMSLYLRRRVVLAFGMLGIFGYLAWLSDSVFRSMDIFPIVLAALGIAMIGATVWLQRRFPSLVARVDATRGSRGFVLPWSPSLSFLAPFAGVVLALAALAERPEVRRQTEFAQRLRILTAHSHRELRAAARDAERARSGPVPGKGPSGETNRGRVP